MCFTILSLTLKVVVADKYFSVLFITIARMNFSQALNSLP